MVDFRRDEKGKILHDLPPLEKLILEPAKGIAKSPGFCIDWTVKAGPITVDTTPRAVMLLKAKRETIIWFSNFTWRSLTDPAAEMAMAIITQDAWTINKRLLKPKGYVGQSTIEAVEDCALGITEQVCFENIKFQEIPPPDFYFSSPNINIFMEPGKCLAFIAYTSSGTGQCEVTVYGSRSASKYTMKPGFIPMDGDKPNLAAGKIPTTLFKTGPDGKREIVHGPHKRF